MNAIPTSYNALNTLLLPTKYRPCLPTPTPDGQFHISTALTGSMTPGTPTDTMCGSTAKVSGSTLGPFVLHTQCWEIYEAQLLEL